MGIKEVKKCRFYVDMFTYFHATKYHNFFTRGDARFLYLDPSKPNVTKKDPYNTGMTSYFFCGNSIEQIDQSLKFVSLPEFQVNAIGMFNHNMGNLSHAEEMIINLRVRDDNGESQPLSTSFLSGIKTTNNINIDAQVGSNGIDAVFDRNGWSMTHLVTEDNARIQNLNVGPISLDWKQTTDQWDTSEYPQAKLHIGSWFVGRYWDTPHSPNLTLSVKTSYDGISRSKTLADKHMTNINYTAPEEWTQYHAKETFIQDSNAPTTFNIPNMEYTESKLAIKYDDGSDWNDGISRLPYGNDYKYRQAKTGMGRQGKRTWNLSFDHVSDTDMFIEKEWSNPSFNDDGTGDLNIQSVQDDSFGFVWKYTLGGNLPFLFCPNTELITSNSRELVDNMAICIFDNKSLQVRQTAPNLYNVSVSIKEL